MPSRDTYNANAVADGDVVLAPRCPASPPFISAGANTRIALGQATGREQDNGREVAPTPHRIDAALACTLAYVHGRQSTRDGFCFYRSADIDEPNLHDTYYALATLAQLGLCLPTRRPLLDFLHGFSALDAHGLFFGDAVGVRASRSIVARVANLAIGTPSVHVGLSSWLLRSVRLVRLKHRFRQPVPTPMLAEVVRAAEHEGGIGEPANLGDTYIAWRLCQQLGVLHANAKRRRFIANLQEPQFGFRATAAATMPNLDTLYAGVGCCRLLACDVRYPAAVLNFILASQADNGGFARVPQALPDLEYTYRTVAMLRALRR